MIVILLHTDHRRGQYSLINQYELIWAWHQRKNSKILEWAIWKNDDDQEASDGSHKI